MNDSIKIDLPLNGGQPTVEGVQAVAVALEHRRNDEGGLEVRYVCTPAGDNALYAGTLTATFVLTKPEPVPGIDTDEQSTVAAEYSQNYIATLSRLIPDSLLSSFDEAAGSAVAEEKLLDGLTNAIGLIAILSLAKAGGDKAKAKATIATDFRDHLETFGGTLPDGMLDKATGLVRDAIDLIDTDA